MVRAIRRRIAGDEVYPGQYWLLFWATLLFRASFSMMWPFTTIYVRERLDIAVTTATLLLSVQAAASLITIVVVSSLMDRFGRKNAMIVGVVAEALVLAGMTVADSLGVWIALMALHGALNPLFSVGVNTMITDLIAPEQRAPAFALNRMVSNAGIAVGPVIGGLLAQISFELIFLSIAGVFLALAAAMAATLGETVPDAAVDLAHARTPGYGPILPNETSYIGAQRA